MPNRCPVWIAEYIWATRFSRMRFLIAGVPIMISWAATRPPPFLLSRVWEMTAVSDSESIALTMSFSAAGNTSTIRSMVFAAELVCRVPNTRWPVSAAVRASRMVSRSRSSPTRMTSGSSRRAERNASAKPSVCRWTSRWLTRHCLLRCTNSIGSSMVRMCPRSVSFLWSIIAARVVDLPDPVGPVTSTTPRGVPATSRKISGARSSFRDGTLDGMARNTAPAPRWWLNALARKRARPGTSNEKSVSRRSS